MSVSFFQRSLQKHSLLLFFGGVFTFALLGTLISAMNVDSTEDSVFQGDVALWMRGNILETVSIRIGSQEVCVDIVRTEREVAIGITRQLISRFSVGQTQEKLHEWKCYYIGDGVVVVAIQKPYYHSLAACNDDAKP